MAKDEPTPDMLLTTLDALEKLPAAMHETASDIGSSTIAGYAEVARGMLMIVRSQVERQRQEIAGWEQVAAAERESREAAQQIAGDFLAAKSRLELRAEEAEEQLAAAQATIARWRPILEVLADDDGERVAKQLWDIHEQARAALEVEASE